MKFHFLGVVLAGIFLSPVKADLVNGRVDSSVICDANSISVASDVDEGWHARSSSLYDLSLHDIWFGGLTYQPGYWFGQIFTDNYSTCGNGNFNFEVTYMGANIRSAMFAYAIYGTDATNSSTTSFALNTDSNPAAGSAWTLMSSGTVASGAEGTYQTNINFGTETYKYMAVRFRFSGATAGRGTDYATAVDNISITPDSVIPEPAAISLIALGGIVTLVTSRFRRGIRFS